jgi:hypothetical protein
MKLSDCNGILTLWDHLHSLPHRFVANRIQSHIGTCINRQVNNNVKDQVRHIIAYPVRQSVLDPIIIELRVIHETI